MRDFQERHRGDKNKACLDGHRSTPLWPTKHTIIANEAQVIFPHPMGGIPRRRVRSAQARAQGSC